MVDRSIFRLGDIRDAVIAIEELLSNRTYEMLVGDKVSRAAFERFLEIISEASRHVPEALKAETTHIPWKRVADIGNHLRHAYHRVDMEALWTIHENGQLSQIRGAIEIYLKKQAHNNPP
jgi:uncharacterized protein with HEPN domain